VKNRLRKSTRNYEERLSALILMHCERRIMDSLDSKDLIALFAETDAAVERGTPQYSTKLALYFT
jgi:hypothetical protein